MPANRTILAGALALLASGCMATGNPGKLAIKALPSPLAQGEHPVSFRVAEAAGQFRLGNVALALESYRKALRDEPQSVDALVGMAACFDSMGRFDMSRRSYEAALAVAPADTKVLAQFAGSLMQQGRADEAVTVRREIAGRLAAAVPTDPATVVTQVAASTVTVKLPEARSTEAARVLLPLARSAAPESQAQADVAERPTSGPRLERLSLGEVALFTLSPKSHDAVRSDTRPLLVLNASRTQGLARRARAYLASRGFGAVKIGDAPRVRGTTLILYPTADRERALRLATTFATRTIVIPGKRLTLLLGRDAAAQHVLRS